MTELTSCVSFPLGAGTELLADQEFRALSVFLSRIHSNLSNLHLSLNYNQGDLCSIAEGGYLAVVLKTGAEKQDGKPGRKGDILNL